MARVEQSERLVERVRRNEQRRRELLTSASRELAGAMGPGQWRAVVRDFWETRTGNEAQATQHAAQAAIEVENRRPASPPRASVTREFEQNVPILRTRHNRQRNQNPPTFRTRQDQGPNYAPRRDNTAESSNTSGTVDADVKFEINLTADATITDLTQLHQRNAHRDQRVAQMQTTIAQQAATIMNLRNEIGSVRAELSRFTNLFYDFARRLPTTPGNSISDLGIQESLQPRQQEQNQQAHVTVTAPQPESAADSQIAESGTAEDRPELQDDGQSPPNPSIEEESEDHGAGS